MSMKKLRVFEAFAGIGAQSEAFRRLGASFDVVGWADIDKRAIKIYEKLHPNCVANSHDITKLERLPECDLLTYSSPCQDFSVAGRRAGGDKGSGTKSSLIWEIQRLLGDCKERGCLPKYLLLENVLGLVSAETRLFFDAWIKQLSDDFGYATYAGILDAQDFNVPHSRKRVFAVSVLGGTKPFIFPVGERLPLTLEDVRDPDCKKQYITKKQIESCLLSGFKSLHDRIRFLEQKSGCLTAHGAKQAFCVAELVSISSKNSQGYRIRSLKDVAFTLTSSGGGFSKTGLYLDDVSTTDVVGGIVDDGGRGAVVVDGHKWHVRKATPRECYRLMGWKDDKIDEILTLGLSDSSHYFVCGNSIVVTCLMAIFGELLNRFEGTDIDWFEKVFGYSKTRKRLF